jgi:hypothetical protein
MAMAGRGGKRDRGKERFWRRMLRQWRRSGLMIREFCDVQGLAEPSFYAWRRTIAQRDQQTARTARPRQTMRREQRGIRATVPGGLPTSDQPAFVPVRVLPEPAISTLELVLDSGHVVRVAPGFDAVTLRQLLTVLEELRPC